MIPVLTRAQARAHDRHAIEQLGVAGSILMENAGRGAADWIRERLGGQSGPVLVLGGTGQNGGDAWVVARHLHGAGFPVRCVLVGESEQVRGDALPNFRTLRALGLPLQGIASVEEPSFTQFKSWLEQAQLVVDGLFGIGLDRAITGLHAAVIEAVNAVQTRVVALDLPSGIDADTGQIWGCALRAEATATFVASKQGMTQYPGRDFCGEVRVCSIGVAPPAPGNECLIDDDDVLAWLAPRAANAHKHRAGQVLVYAGAAGTTGAALLTGLGALRTGAGLVQLAPRASARAALEQKVLEMMTLALPEADLPACLALAGSAQAAVLGPGFGVDAFASELTQQLVAELPIPLVIDASGLRTLAGLGGPGLCREAPAPRVLTPHPGEAAELLGVSSAEIQADRCAAALALAEGSGQVVVLKGASTVVAGPEGRLRICMAGTPAMAMAGMGDVLAGMVAALVCSLAPLEAAAAAVQLHARAGEFAAHTDRGLLASELADAVPRVLPER